MNDSLLEIRSKIDNHDFEPWVEEKIRNVITGILHISIHDEISETFYYSALGDAIKIYSFCVGVPEIYNDKEILNFIFDNGLDGFIYVEKAFNLSSDSGVIEKIINDNSLILTIKSLITPDKMNRTQIHETLAKLNKQNDWTKMIADDIEKVTMGEKDWDWFYYQHKDDSISRHLFTAPEIPEVLMNQISKTEV